MMACAGQRAAQLSLLTPLTGGALIPPGVGLLQDAYYEVPSEHGHITKALDYVLGWGEGAQMPSMPKPISDCRKEHDSGCIKVFWPNNIWWISNRSV